MSLHGEFPSVVALDDVNDPNPPPPPLTSNIPVVLYYLFYRAHFRLKDGGALLWGEGFTAVCSNGHGNCHSS